MEKLIIFSGARKGKICSLVDYGFIISERLGELHFSDTAIYRYSDGL